MTAEVSPRKATTPVAISYSTAPKENRSVRRSSSFALAPAPATCRRPCPRWMPGLVRYSSSISVAAAVAAGLVDAAVIAGDDLGQAEVENLGVAALGDEDVRGLDVAMDDSLGVRGVEGVGDLDGERRAGCRVPAADRRSGASAWHAIEILHGDEGFAVLLADVVNGADVGMVERGSGLRLALEAGQRLRIAGDFVGQELQGHEAVQARVLGFVDHTHAAAAEFFDECGNEKWSARSLAPNLTLSEDRQVNEDRQVEPLDLGPTVFPLRFSFALVDTPAHPVFPSTSPGLPRVPLSHFAAPDLALSSASWLVHSAAKTCYASSRSISFFM